MRTRCLHAVLIWVELRTQADTIGCSLNRLPVSGVYPHEKKYEKKFRLETNKAIWSPYRQTVQSPKRRARYL